ncbi:MAG: hypothetical protein GTN93_23390 [Anaerolineae bacterium]|nr:hypothetical protein [Anaerolineae bacterium]
MPRPEDIIADASARRRKLAGSKGGKSKSGGGPNMSEFVADVQTALGEARRAGTDTVRQKKAKAMFAKIRKKHGIK